MKKKPDVWTLTQAARVLGEPQHRLIYLCEKGVIEPDFQDAKGRGSSRRFSARNLLEFSIALRLRELDIGVSFVGAVIHVLRAFERNVRKELREFTLPESLRDPGAPEFRLVISDGGRLYFTLTAAKSPPRLYGGVDLTKAISTPGSRGIGRAVANEITPIGKSKSRSLGGPEVSRFLRLELSITELAREIRLDAM
jgi:DNA-binding transcriptional MerR regulator